MPYRLIQVMAPASDLETMKTLTKDPLVVDHWTIESESDRFACALLTRAEDTQALTDKIQTFTDMGNQKAVIGVETDRHGVRMVILPVEATLPRQERPSKTTNGKKPRRSISREEVYEDVAKGAEMNRTFFMLVVFSTIVAAIGLLEDNVAVVIGAMVIAPLLGPNLALSLATVLGDKDMFFQSLKVNLLGMGLCLVLAFSIGKLWPYDLDSRELLSRTHIGFDSIALAIASGAAGVLSLMTGISSVLVGVMVAVALLPPAVAVGIMLGAGMPSLALGAGLLLVTNIVCINLSAKVVFMLKGIAPLGWNDQRQAKTALWWHLLFWCGALSILAITIYIRGHYFDL